MKQTGKSVASRSESSRRVFALICLVLFVGLQIFASSSALHRAIHNDADSPTHHCVISLIKQGEATVAAAPNLSVTFAIALLFFLAPFHSVVTASLDRR